MLEKVRAPLGAVEVPVEPVEPEVVVEVPDVTERPRAAAPLAPVPSHAFTVTLCEPVDMATLAEMLLPAPPV